MSKARRYVSRTPMFAQLNISGRYSVVENIYKYTIDILKTIRIPMRNEIPELSYTFVTSKNF